MGRLDKTEQMFYNKTASHSIPQSIAGLSPFRKATRGGLYSCPDRAQLPQIGQGVAQIAGAKKQGARSASPVGLFCGLLFQSLFCSFQFCPHSAKHIHNERVIIVGVAYRVHFIRCRFPCRRRGGEGFILRVEVKHSAVKPVICFRGRFPLFKRPARGLWALPDRRGPVPLPALWRALWGFLRPAARPAGASWSSMRRQDRQALRPVLPQL